LSNPPLLISECGKVSLISKFGPIFPNIVEPLELAVENVEVGSWMLFEECVVDVVMEFEGLRNAKKLIFKSFWKFVKSVKFRLKIYLEYLLIVHIKMIIQRGHFKHTSRCWKSNHFMSFKIYWIFKF
jgi:hypothetical protein